MMHRTLAAKGSITVSRYILSASLLALVACTMETPPTSSESTIEENPISGDDYVCVTTSYDLTECTLRADLQPTSPAP
jgi:hypothetical protein